MTRDAPQTDDEPTVDGLTDPDSLRDRDGVDYREETNQVDAETFTTVREDLTGRGGWIVAGVENDAGAVLLMDDGSHGWTLPAAPVDAGADWAARGRATVEGLTGRAVGLDRPERVRRIDYREEGGDGRISVHHLVVRTDLVAGAPTADDPTVGCDGSPEVGWFDALPDDVDGSVADDIRLFL